MPSRSQPAPAESLRAAAEPSAAPMQGTTRPLPQFTHTYPSMYILLLRGMPPVAAAPAPVMKAMISSPAAPQQYAAPMPGNTSHL